MQHNQKPRPSLAEPLIALLLIVAVIGTLAVAWYVPAHARQVAEAQEQECRGHLLAIFQAIQRYRADHHGRYPDSLVQPPPVFRRWPPITSLAPSYLAPSQVLCPADERGGFMLGWDTRCSYVYELQELTSRVPVVRRRVQTALIDKYGPKLRLMTCASAHRTGPLGSLTLHADGQIYKEAIFPNDPQNLLRESLHTLEAASLPKPPIAAPPGSSWLPKPVVRR